MNESVPVTVASAGSVPTVLPRFGAAASALPGLARFLGGERAFFGLLARGAALLLLTLGLYRFWLATDVRRFLWGNTDIAGDTLEYVGTPRELFIGFLMAIALLAPLNLLLFLATLSPGMLAFSGPLGFALLTLLGQFAVFRARRYRLTRTVLRGIRFNQTGSAWLYAARALAWWIVTALTAGLAYPWMLASLERYKMRHTHYGNLAGRFEGSGTGLFVRGVFPWLIVVGPMLAGLIAALTGLVQDRAALAGALNDWSTLGARLDEVMPLFATALVLISAGFGWGLFAAIMLYPVFRAIVLRWWVSGLHLGPMSATSQLRNGQVYRAYLRFLGYAGLFTAVILAVLALGAGLWFAGGEATVNSDTIQLAGGFSGLLLYVVYMLGSSAIYQATVLIRFWRLSFETAVLNGLEALDHVEGRSADSSAFGEGLADALDAGGL